MAHANTVLRSINLDGEGLCVDLFRRPDGTLGFETFRRDPEDGRGWFAVGHFGHQVFDTPEAALDAACTAVPWLADVLDRDGAR